LNDPLAKAQILARLAPSAPPKIVPFWRHPGLLGAAASLLVAATAGLVVLRSPVPVPVPTVAKPTTDQAPALKSLAEPTEAAAPAAPEPKARRNAEEKRLATTVPALEAPIPTPQATQTLAAAGATGVAMVAAQDTAMAQARDQADRRDNLAKKAEAPRPAAVALLEVVASAPPPPSAPKAKASGAVAQFATVSAVAPAWSLDLLPNGITRVTVSAARTVQVVVLKRTSSGVEALAFQAIEDSGETLTRWRGEVRLATGDALDLYLLQDPVAEPTRLPEHGPVQGFRARIHPKAKSGAGTE
jgi:hypothetical protein